MFVKNLLFLYCLALPYYCLKLYKSIDNILCITKKLVLDSFLNHFVFI